jgi:hypothetical protein
VRRVRCTQTNVRHMSPGASAAGRLWPLAIAVAMAVTAAYGERQFLEVVGLEWLMRLGELG